MNFFGFWTFKLGKWHGTSLSWTVWEPPRRKTTPDLNLIKPANVIHRGTNYENGGSSALSTLCILEMVCCWPLLGTLWISGWNSSSILMALLTFQWGYRAWGLEDGLLSLWGWSCQNGQQTPRWQGPRGGWDPPEFLKAVDVLRSGSRGSVPTIGESDSSTSLVYSWIVEKRVHPPTEPWIWE